MDVEAFVSIIDRQYSFLIDRIDLDGYYLDVSVDQWQRRNQSRGWTRADVRRQADFLDQTPPHERDNPVGYRFPSSRVFVAAKIFDLPRPVVSAANKSLQECDLHQDLAEVAPLIVRMVATHQEWIKWIKNGDPSDADQRWESDRAELGRLLHSYGLLRMDPRKSAWNRWRDALSSVDRVRLLNLFWLAKKPLLNEEIREQYHRTIDVEPRRKLIVQVNKVAAVT